MISPHQTTGLLVLPPSQAMNRQYGWAAAVALPVVLTPLWCLAMSRLPAPLGSAHGGILSMLLVTATVTDIAYRKIYNWATYAAIAWAVALNALPLTAGHWGTIGLGDCLYGGMLNFVCMLFAYTLARGGAGDVKLATAIGCLVGPDVGVLAIAASYILAAVAILAWSANSTGGIAFLRILFRSMASAVTPGTVQPPRREQRRLLAQPIPLAPFFALGTLAVLLWNGS